MNANLGTHSLDVCPRIVATTTSMARASPALVVSPSSVRAANALSCTTALQAYPRITANTAPKADVSMPSRPVRPSGPRWKGRGDAPPFKR